MLVLCVGMGGDGDGEEDDDYVVVFLFFLDDHTHACYSRPFPDGRQPGCSETASIPSTAR